MGNHQSRIICWGGLTFDVWVVVIPLPKLDSGNLEVEGVEWLYWHGSISFSVELLQFIMTCPAMPGLEAEPPDGDPNGLLQSWIIWWTLQDIHFSYHQSPDRYCRAATIIHSGTLVLHNTMQHRRSFEDNHLMDNKEWLNSGMRVISLGVFLDSSVSSNSSPGQA